jgi:dehydrogenase/reductase SDR family protein 7B
MKFKDKKVWITGASSGAGEALAYEFNKEGAEIIISARREEELKRVKMNCQFPDMVHIACFDMENHEEIKITVEKTMGQFEYIDILFNNAGISQRSLASETDFSVDKKYLGPVALTKAVLPSMIKRKAGHIVVMSSLTGKFGARLRSGYSGSKHALHGYFDSLRAEIYVSNIFVTLICSGYIRTNIAKNALTETGEKQKKEDPNIAKGMSPEEFAKKTIKAVFVKKLELTLGGKEKLGVYLKRFFPCLFSKLIRERDG